MLCSLLRLARRLITHELGEQHSQSTGNNHEYSIIQQWKSASLRRTKVPTTATINHAGRKRADKDRLGKTAIAQTQRSGCSSMIKIRSSKELRSVYRPYVPSNPSNIFMNSIKTENYFIILFIWNITAVLWTLKLQNMPLFSNLQTIIIHQN